MRASKSWLSDSVFLILATRSWLPGLGYQILGSVDAGYAWKMVWPFRPRSGQDDTFIDVDADPILSTPMGREDHVIFTYRNLHKSIKGNPPYRLRRSPRSLTTTTTYIFL